MKSNQQLQFFATPQYPCAYLPGRIARNYVIDPDFEMDSVVYSQLIEMGFRRSGTQVYKPECNPCKECISTRILVNYFKPSRSQRRNLRNNKDLSIKVNKEGFKDEYLALYEEYLVSRHDNDDTAGIKDFFEADWCTIYFIEFHIEDNLLGVAVVDVLDNSLSSVYTFFKPEEAGKRSLGTFAVLWQLEYAKQHNKQYVYPGYWIKDCNKMNYKTRFQPLEGNFSGKWLKLEK